MQNINNLLAVKTPAYIIDEAAIINNCKILKGIKDATGCKILLASKAFSSYCMFNTIKEYLDGMTSSSLHEARLSYEEMHSETHIFSPGYRDDEFDEICTYSDHIVFNSFNQWNHFKATALSHNISCGLRINPEYSEVEVDLYNPCAKGSRLGITFDNFNDQDLTGIEGLHFHCLCEQGADVLVRTLEAVETKFGPYLTNLKWLNFGGGHHITRQNYDLTLLISTINRIKNTYNLQVYLEPGEAVALNAGFLVSSVLDITTNSINNAILDTSAATHMPDVLEMPYRPNVINAKEANILDYTYRFGGPTCLSGDIIGDYSFNKPLEIGDKVIFEDMAIYTMVKNNTFNGINLPSIYILKEDSKLELHKSFNYNDFKTRL
ncbi:MAG: carboxynorspermidine decarboxylase [Erysipelotrichaceae bacterium]